MAKAHDTAKISFEQQLWKAMLIMQGSVDITEYKHILLGLIFLKYISDKFDKRHKAILDAGEDAEDKNAYTAVNDVFVPVEARWNKTIAEAAHSEEIGTVIDNAMLAIERENNRLKDALPKGYARSELDKSRLGDLVDLFTSFKLIEHGASKDILGRAYEFCLSKFAEQAGKSAGEFYTPPCIVQLLIEALRPFKGRIYDPSCGSGGMFVQSARFVESRAGNSSSLSVYGQELNPATRRMALMNLAVHGINANLGASNADTLRKDLHPELKADFILANPPFNLSGWNDGSLDNDKRWKYGLPPAGNANYAWIQHMIHHLAPSGKIGLVLANGSLSSQTGSEGEIRKRIIEDDLVAGIIGLPGQLFFNTQIPVSVWLISRDKPQKGKTLFIDARSMGAMITRTLRELSTKDIERITAAFQAFEEGRLENVKGFCAAVSTEEIAKQDYILTPGRYVGVEEQADDGEPFNVKMPRMINELKVMLERSHEQGIEIIKRLTAIKY